MSVRKCHLDFETRSDADLLKVGAWAYAAHPSTDVTCMGWAVGDQKPVVFTTAQVRQGPRMIAPRGIPADLQFVAHNFAFEYAIWHFVLHKKYGWPSLLEPSRWSCTMARAHTCGLPGSLEGAALALNLDWKKDLDGKQAMYKLCRPQLDGTWCEDPAVYDRLYRYNAVDVETERALDKALPEMTEAERKVFELDLVINRRGIAIDINSAARAQAIAAELTDELNKKLRKMTRGAVTGATQLPSLKLWVAAQGVTIPTKTVEVKGEGDELTEEERETLDKEAVGDLCKDPSVPQVVKDVLRIRQQVGKSSVSKFKTMNVCICGDRRMRGAFQYHGAHTGRWAGRLLQLHNFPQGLVGEEQETAIEVLGLGSTGFSAVYGEKSMQTLSDILRGMLVPAEGKMFLGADLNAIEARVVFWLADERAALAQYGRGESPYLSMGARIFGRPITKKDAVEYKIAKMTVLGAGFGMGWIRFQAQVYTETAKTGEALWIEDDLAQKSIRSYREEYAGVVGLWYAMEAAAINAVQNPGQMFATANGRVLWGMSKDRRFLVCKLPSGRFLRYFRPSVHVEKNKFGKEKPTLFYWGSASKGALKTEANGMLGWYKTWGGELVENVVQAVARDILVAGMMEVEEHGYPIVLHAHDELLVEIPTVLANYSGAVIAPDYSTITLGIVDALTKLMSKPLAWAPGLPIAAEGFVSRRYRK